MNPSKNCTSTLLLYVTEGVGLLVIILTLVYIIQYQNGFGGRENPSKEYNWHIFFMMVGFIYLSGNSLLIFRILPSFPKSTLKLIHLGLNGAVIVCSVLGLFFIIDMKNITGRNHFQSLHSWMGIFTIVLLVIQFATGAYTYMSSRAPIPVKAALMPWHVKIGITIFLLGAVTILTVLGHGKSTSERFLKNFIGGSIIIFCFLVVHLLSDQTLKYGSGHSLKGAPDQS